MTEPHKIEIKNLDAEPEREGIPDCPMGETEQSERYAIDNWEKEFSDKFGEMLENRLHHSSVSHYRDVGKGLTKGEVKQCWRFAESKVNELRKFIEDSIHQAIEGERKSTITLLKAIALADGFIGLTDEEWRGVRKFIPTFVKPFLSPPEKDTNE